MEWDLNTTNYLMTQQIVGTLSEGKNSGQIKAITTEFLEVQICGKVVLKT